MRYPAQYTWLVFVAALDLMFTWIVLHSGGTELNLFADAVIDAYGIWGLSAFKFGMILFVICLCEIVGRRRHGAGRFLAVTAVVLNCIPVRDGGVPAAAVTGPTARPAPCVRGQRPGEAARASDLRPLTSPRRLEQPARRLGDNGRVEEDRRWIRRPSATTRPPVARRA